MPNPLGMANQMQPPPMPPQGNSPWPGPMQGMEALLGLINPGTMNLNAFNDQGQFSLPGALGSAVDIGGQLVGMADLPGKKQLGGMAGRMMNRGGEDLARSMGGFSDNAAGTIRGNIPPQRMDPGNLGAMDQMAPPGGGAPPMDMPNQAWNDSLADYDRWNSANMGPDDFANPDDFARHQDYMQQGPTPGPMNFVASSQDPAQLIQQAALDMIQQGVPPAEAIQAATMQFSDLLRP